ncbi:MAG: hypothetical protein IJ435_07360 [Clostridia bacterium]|nr:hypothetical protein [Clostridia bacterium]
MRKIARIALIISDIIHLPCVSYGLMLLTLKVNELHDSWYAIFRQGSFHFLLCGFWLRAFYLSYIIFAAIIGLYAFSVVKDIRNKVKIPGKIIALEIILWIIFAIEIIFLEGNFWALATF